MPFFPSSVPTTLQLLQAMNNTKVILDGNINDVITTIPVVDTSDIPASGFLTFEDGTNEVIEYTGKTLTTLTGCVRGADNTTASGHADGNGIGVWWIAKHHNILSEEINSICQNLSDRIGLHTTRIILQDYLDANSKKISGLAAGTVAGDAVRYEQVLLLSGGTMTGNIITPSSSAGAAAIGIGAADTGLFSAGANIISFTAGGVERARITDGVNYFYKDLNIIRADYAGELQLLAKNTNASPSAYATIVSAHNNGTYEASMTMYTNVDVGGNRNMELLAAGVPILEGDAAGGVSEMLLKINVWNGGKVTAMNIPKTGEVQFQDGSVSAPSVAFASDTNSGMFLRSAGNGVALAFNGVMVCSLTDTGGTTFHVGPVAVIDGSVSTPAVTFLNYRASGMYLIAANNYGFSVNGVLIADLSSTGMDMNGYKITGLAAATTNGDAVRYEQVSGIFSVNENFKNLLVNGAFRIWNQGRDFQNPASGTLICDGWILYKGGSTPPTVDANRVSTNYDNGPSCLALACTNAGSGLTDGIRLYQPLYDIEKRPYNKYLTVTARVKTSTASKWRVGLSLGASTSYSSYHTGSGNYETLTVSKLINHQTDGIAVEIGMLQSGDVAVSFAYIDNVMLTVGQVAIDYSAESYPITLTKASYKDFLTYRRPDLSWESITEIGAEPNTYRLGVTEIVVMFPDGEMRRVLGSDTNLRRMNITETAANTGTLNSGLRSGISEASNTWYAIYAWKSADDDGKFVLVGDTTPPSVDNYATLNTRYGENAWVFLGYVRNGMNVFSGAGQDNDLLRFTQHAGITLFPTSVGSRYPFGLTLAQATTATLTYSPTTGMGTTDLPPTVGHVKWGTQCSGTGGGTGFSVTSGVSPTNGFMFEDSGKLSTHFMGVEVWGPRVYGCELKNSVTQPMTINCAGFIDLALVGQPCALR